MMTASLLRYGVLCRRGIYFFLIAFLMSSCFGNISDTVELPYEEKLVVRGLLIAGEPVTDIHISRTLPPLDSFTYEKIFIADADARIIVDGQSYTMELQPQMPMAVPYRSLYRVPNLRAEAGKTYALVVKARDLTATATTTVPPLPVVDSARVVPAFPRTSDGRPDTVFTTEVFLSARAGEMMRVGSFVVNSRGMVNSRGFGDVSFFEAGRPALLQSNDWRLTTATVQILSGAFEVRAVVEAFDGDYYRYYQTRNRGGQPSPLNPGGPNVEWNVSGDGIGMFVGLSQAFRRAPVRR